MHAKKVFYLDREQVNIRAPEWAGGFARFRGGLWRC